MGAMTLGMKRTDDGRSLRIEINDNGIAAAWLDANASEVDALIAALGRVRANMTPEVPRTSRQPVVRQSFFAHFVGRQHTHRQRSPPGSIPLPMSSLAR